MADIIAQTESGRRDCDDAYIAALKIRDGAQPTGAVLHATPKIEKAIRAAARLHAGQIRKGRAAVMPYICHPLSVAEIIAKYTQDDDVIAAGLMHDTLEDCDYSVEGVTADFGARVRDIVQGLTEDPELKRDKDQRGTWRERKQRYLDHLREAPEESLLVGCADKIHNMETMALGFAELGAEAFWSRFNAPLADQLWYYDSFIAAVKRRLRSDIVVELETAYDKLKAVFAGRQSP